MANPKGRLIIGDSEYELSKEAMDTITSGLPCEVPGVGVVNPPTLVVLPGHAVPTFNPESMVQNGHGWAEPPYDEN